MPAKKQPADVAPTYSWDMWQPVTGPKTEIGQITWDGDRARRVVTAGNLEADRTLYALLPCTFIGHDLGGYERRQLDKIAEQVNAIREPMAHVFVQKAPISFLDLLAVPGQAERSVAELEAIVNAENDLKQNQQISQTATTDPEMAVNLKKMNQASRGLALQRAAIYWGLEPSTMEVVADFPGAFSEDYETGWLADWLEETDRVIELLGKSKKKAGDS